MIESFAAKGACGFLEFLPTDEQAMKRRSYIAARTSLTDDEMPQTSSRVQQFLERQRRREEGKPLLKREKRQPLHRVPNEQQKQEQEQEQDGSTSRHRSCPDSPSMSVSVATLSESEWCYVFNNKPVLRQLATTHSVT